MVVVYIGSKFLLFDEIILEDLFRILFVFRERGLGILDVFERVLFEYNMKLLFLNVFLYLGSIESIKLFLEYIDCIGIVFICFISCELFLGIFCVIEIKGMLMLCEFCFV